MIEMQKGNNMIDRVITSLQDPYNMEKINSITGLDLFNTDNWCDLDQFIEKPKLTGKGSSK